MTTRAQSLFSQPLLECASKCRLSFFSQSILRQSAQSAVSSSHPHRPATTCGFLRAKTLICGYLRVPHVFWSGAFQGHSQYPQNPRASTQTVCVLLHAVKRFFALFCGAIYFRASRQGTILFVSEIRRVKHLPCRIRAEADRRGPQACSFFESARNFSKPITRIVFANADASTLEPGTN